ncbi:LysR family transcriptional regulator [Psychromonas sp.]|uniref:LysR family transcriptional regulator n=1 Tax=Psychromonas sp. TaxID=1884585 RepID=UPI003562F5EC
MDQLRALKYFVKVVETGSFTKAARLFSVPPSSLSRRVADLESMLGATLLQRSTRLVKLTEIGAEYYQQVSEVIAQLEDCNETVRRYQEVPIGKLRITSMVGFGERILIPILDEFSALYPKIVLDVHLSDELSAIGRDDVDLAIRGGGVPGERVVAIQLMENEFIPAASPGYLQRMGTPTNACQLSEHKGLYFRTPTGPTPWLCEIDGKWQDVSAPKVAVSNGGSWLLSKAVQGQGIVMLPRWVLKPYLERGELKELHFKPGLTTSTNSEIGIYLLYQKQRYHIPKIKAMVDFLVARIKGVY